MVSPWKMSDSKSPQVSRTLLSILIDLNNAVVWIVSIRLSELQLFQPLFPSLWGPFEHTCLCTSMWRGPQKYITYELVPTSPAVSHILQIHLLFNSCSPTARKTGGPIPDRVIPKTKKNGYLTSHCLTLTIIKYRSRVTGAIQGKE